MSNIQDTSDADFASDIEQNSQATLVDFYADWCGPCKVIAPLLEEIATDYAGKMKFYRLDVDANPQTAIKYNVRGIPTLLIFINGEIKDSLVGAVGKNDLIKFVEKHL